MSSAIESKSGQPMAVHHNPDLSECLPWGWGKPHPLESELGSPCSPPWGELLLVLVDCFRMSGIVSACHSEFTSPVLAPLMITRNTARPPDSEGNKIG